jgi:hypothetical protein
MTFNLGEDIHALERRRDRYLEEVKAANSSDDLRDLGREIIANRERREWATQFAAQGVGNAKKMLVAMETLKAGMLSPPVVAMRGRNKDEEEIAHSCGSAERAYRARLSGDDLMARTLPGIPHEDYRVLVMRTALKLASKPSTKDFARAKALVDKQLVDQGVGVVIPHAQPGRVTR